jgi:hypothetical protein
MSTDSNFVQSVVTATLVRFIVQSQSQSQSQSHQPNLPLMKSFRSKLFYTVMITFQLLKYQVKLVINRNPFRFILYLHIYSSS